ncbi:MAG: hypothetical protein Q9172_005697 [Xanthocarpia lactea]
MLLLLASALLSGLAVVLTIVYHTRRSHDIGASPVLEKTDTYKDEKPDSDPLEPYSETSGTPIAEHIVRSDVERGTWVLRMVCYMFSERHKGQHNVVVINDELEYYFKPENVVERFVVEYKNSKRPWVVPYSVVVFRQGTLLNRGDGGDINWDWQGNFTRSGGSLLTFYPCVPGVVYKQDAWNAT